MQAGVEILAADKLESAARNRKAFERSMQRFGGADVGTMTAADAAFEAGAVATQLAIARCIARRSGTRMRRVVRGVITIPGASSELTQIFLGPLEHEQGASRRSRELPTLCSCRCR